MDHGPWAAAAIAAHKTTVVSLFTVAYLIRRGIAPLAPTMDFSVLFARHFARLIWLIRTQPDSVDDQKGALRALVTVAKEGAVALRAEEGRLTANGTPLPEILTGIKDVATGL